MIIQNIEINNILSIESANLAFDSSSLVLVEGWNHDADRANGAGKTALFNAISFALFDKMPRKITASEILKRGSKTGFAEVTLKSGNHTWKVKRHRPKNVEFHKDGIKVDITQDEFEAAIRFSYEQFILTVYNAQSNSESTRFILRSDTEKKSFLLQLLNLNSFSEAKKASDDLIKQISTTIDSLNLKIKTADSKIDAYSESLIDVEETQDAIDQIDRNLKKVNKELEELAKVEQPDLSKFHQFDSDIASKRTEIFAAKSLRTNLADTYRELSAMSQTIYDPNQKCGECGSSLDTPEARELHKEAHDRALLKIKKIKDQIDDLDKVIAKESSINELAKKIKDKKSTMSSDYQRASERISELKSFIAVAINKKVNLAAKITSNQEVQDKIETLKESKAVNFKHLAAHNSNLEFYKTLSSIFAPTGAQAYILDSMVESFNDLVQGYVDIVWPNTSYSLQSQKETSKGDVVAKFSEILTMDGKEISVGSLSGGELRALSLCIDFALLEVLSTRFGLNLNPIILDEPFDGLDSVGREIVITLLNSLAKDHQILVVDHASESKVLFSKTIRVEKKGGTSTIKVEV